MQSNFRVRHSLCAFTLIELMVLMVFVGILAAIGVSQYKKYSAAAKKAEAFEILAVIEKSERAYFSQNNVFMPTEVQPYYPMGGPDDLLSSWYMGSTNTWIKLGLPVALGTKTLFRYSVAAGIGDKIDACAHPATGNCAAPWLAGNLDMHVTGSVTGGPGDSEVQQIKCLSNRWNGSAWITNSVAGMDLTLSELGINPKSDANEYKWAIPMAWGHLDLSSGVCEYVFMLLESRPSINGGEPYATRGLIQLGHDYGTPTDAPGDGDTGGSSDGGSVESGGTSGDEGTSGSDETDQGDGSDNSNCIDQCMKLGKSAEDCINACGGG